MSREFYNRPELTTEQLQGVNAAGETLATMQACTASLTLSDESYGALLDLGVDNGSKLAIANYVMNTPDGSREVQILTLSARAYNSEVVTLDEEFPEMESSYGSIPVMYRGEILVANNQQLLNPTYEDVVTYNKVWQIADMSASKPQAIITRQTRKSFAAFRPVDTENDEVMAELKARGFEFLDIAGQKGINSIEEEIVVDTHVLNAQEASSLTALVLEAQMSGQAR